MWIELGRGIRYESRSYAGGASIDEQIATKTIANEVERATKQKAQLETELAEFNVPKLVKLPTFEEFQTQSMIAKALLSPEEISQKRRVVSMFVKSITLAPIAKEVVVEYYENPLRTLLENCTKAGNASPNKKGSLLKTSSELVAGAGFEPTTFGL